MPYYYHLIFKHLFVHVLNYTPGSQVSIILETLSSDQRADGYSTPFVSRVILPNLSLSPLYPLDMVRVDTGIYYHRFTLPSGTGAVGSYLVDVVWTDNDNNIMKQLYQIIVNAGMPTTSGNYSASPT